MVRQAHLTFHPRRETEAALGPSIEQEKWRSARDIVLFQIKHKESKVRQWRTDKFSYFPRISLSPEFVHHYLYLRIHEERKGETHRCFWECAPVQGLHLHLAQLSWFALWHEWSLLERELQSDYCWLCTVLERSASLACTASMAEAPFEIYFLKSLIVRISSQNIYLQTCNHKSNIPIFQL